jgi:hypothetical protein
MTQQNLTQAGKVGVIRRARARPSGCIEGVSLSHAGQDDGVGQNAVEGELRVRGYLLLLHAVQSINGRILWANLHLLFWLSLIPFCSGWMGENHFDTLPVALYGVVLLMCGTSAAPLDGMAIIRCIRLRSTGKAIFMSTSAPPPMPARSRTGYATRRGFVKDEATLVGAFEHFYKTNRFGHPDYGTHYVVLTYGVSFKAQQAVAIDSQHSDVQWMSEDEINSATNVHPNTKAYF